MQDSAEDTMESVEVAAAGSSPSPDEDARMSGEAVLDITVEADVHA